MKLTDARSLGLMTKAISFFMSKWSIDTGAQWNVDKAGVKAMRRRRHFTTRHFVPKYAMLAADCRRIYGFATSFARKMGVGNIDEKISSLRVHADNLPWLIRWPYAAIFIIDDIVPSRRSRMKIYGLTPQKASLLSRNETWHFRNNAFHQDFAHYLTACAYYVMACYDKYESNLRALAVLWNGG